MKQFEVIDNFLPLYNWDEIFKFMASEYFPWYKTPDKIPLNPIQDKEYHAFTHNIIFDGKYYFESKIDYADVLMKQLKKIKGDTQLEVIRAKANMFL